jgi:cell division protein FtsQ
VTTTSPADTPEAPPASPVDPRFRARRAAVQRELGRRRLRILVTVASVVVAVGAAYLAVESPFLDVDRVDVVGTRHLPVDEVRRVVEVAHGDALLRIDLGAVERRVEALPWVADADASRDLPGALRVHVTERAPVAFVRGDDGTATLVAADGTVLGVVLVPPPEAVEITGVRRVPSPGSVLSPPAAAGAVAQLPPALATRVGVIALRDGGDVALGLRAGGEVRVCSLDDLPAKGAAALAVLERVAPSPVDYVNVCVPGAPVARLADR